jgi:hypothetical protein
MPPLKFIHNDETGQSRRASACSSVLRARTCGGLRQSRASIRQHQFIAHNYCNINALWVSRQKLASDGTPIFPVTVTVPLIDIDTETVVRDLGQNGIFSIRTS